MLLALLVPAVTWAQYDDLAMAGPAPGHRALNEASIAFMETDAPGVVRLELPVGTDRVDEAIEESIEAGRETPLTIEHMKRAYAAAKPTTLEWLTTARNYARYSNEGGQYDEVLAFLDRHGGHP